ncbi:flagellar export chaperone FliS [Microbacteriaceae bacterium 4G12]
MQAWQRYMQNDIMTSNPIKNTIFIYETCIVEFKKLAEMLQTFRFSEADPLLGKLENIFEELQLQLNPNIDEELYDNFVNLYNWILKEVQKMKITREATEIDSIIYVLEQLTEGYRGVLKNEQ